MRSETHLKSLAIFAAMVLLCSGYAGAGTWTNLNAPGAIRTQINGIDGSNFVGRYMDADKHWHNFLYNGTTWMDLPASGAAGITHPNGLNVPCGATGISGSNIVGTYTEASYHDRGFIYNLNTQSWSSLNKPGATETGIIGIEGSNLVGWSDNGGFLYNMTTQIWTDCGQYMTGISGSNLVGWYLDNSYYVHGFLDWTTLDAPGVHDGDWFDGTYITSISGSNLVGYCKGPGLGYGLLYNMTTRSWATLDYPGAYGTYANGISGNSIVGYYGDSSGYEHGFVYTVPEPATLLLLGFGAVMLRRKEEVSTEANKQR
jgi:hypothetical protein